MKVKKNFKQSKVTKYGEELYLNTSQVKKLLKAAQGRPRDYCVIFLGFHLALRSTECAKLEQDNFREIARGIVFIRRAKRSQKIDCTCRACNKRFKVKMSRSGKTWHCPKCQELVNIPVLKHTQEPPSEIQLPTLEDHAIEYIQEYLSKYVLPEQKYLFQSAPDAHVSETTIRNIFNRAAREAKIPEIYSFHSLRHGRGVQVYETFEDVISVRDMLGQKSMSSAEIYARMSPKKAAQTKTKLAQDSVM